MISYGDITGFIKREKLYVFLLTFVILANFSLLLLNNVFKAAEPTQIFNKEIAADSGKIFDQKVMEAISSNQTLHAVFLFIALIFLFLILAGLIIDTLFVSTRIMDKEPVAVTRTVSTADWGIWDIGKVIIIFFFAESMVSLGAIYAALFLPDLPIEHNLQMIMASTVLDVVAIAAIFYFVLRPGRQGIDSLGLTAKNMLLNIKYGVTAYVGLIPILLGVTLVAAALFKIFNIPVEPQQVVEMLKEETKTPSLIYMVVFASFLGPFMEEIFFRGFVYGALRKKIGVLGSILASAVFFAYVHANMASFMPILSLGILLAYIYEKTGSLVSSVTVHIMHNSFMLVFLLFLKSITN